ncbi:hypothetical protein [Macrococcoides canis]|uniref:hypothetical protein n=1 Tax=Macrococcoides canis TaxID=1855823 RepID=UPI00165E645F|nr:hypothetical protein [Macrococcus canis]QNR08226.1 hypothetical protein GL258_08120 [Macrococcus canis]
MNKNNYFYHWSLVFIVFIVSLYISWLFYLSNKTNVIEVASLFIGFITVFATGYGAYLGAKISGENATKLMKNELIMSDLREHKSADMEFLKEFSEIFNRHKLYEEINRQNFSNRIISTIMACREFNKTNTSLESTSQIIRYQTELFIQDLKKCGISAEILNNKLNRNINNYIKNELNIDDERKSVQIYDVIFIGLLDLYNLGHERVKIKVEIHLVPDEIDILYQELVDKFDHEVNLKNIVDFIFKENDKEINNFINQIKNNITILNNLKFKNQEELRNYILQYYELK